MRVEVEDADARCLRRLGRKMPCQPTERRPRNLVPTAQRDRERAAVEQIVLYASVYDKDSILVENLEKEDFTIFEDRIQQEVTYFGRDDVPSTLGVVIDSSGSMRDKFDLVNDATRLFLSKNNPENELFFVAFKDEVRLEQNFTRDVEDIYDALDNVIISGGTALYDAIYLAVDKALQGNEPKKTVIVFTDGEDKDSYYSHQELLEKVEESDVQLYIVAFLDADPERRHRRTNGVVESAPLSLEVLRAGEGNFAPVEGYRKTWVSVKLSGTNVSGINVYQLLSVDRNLQSVHLVRDKVPLAQLVRLGNESPIDNDFIVDLFDAHS